MPFETRGRLAIIHPEEVERIIVVGDIHGDLYSLDKVKQLFQPEKDTIVFLGDYADRGTNGVEVVESIKELVEKYPRRVLALKGNHEEYSEEGKPTFSPCTLIEEVERKRSSWDLYFRKLKETFLDKLYLAAVIPELALFLHGGISSKIRSEEDLINPSRAVEEDILWSDPSEANGEYENPRGAGILYGPDVSKEIARRLNVSYIVRSHEPRKAFSAPAIEHEGRVVTTSSTSVYGGKPFVLILPTHDLPKSGKKIEKYVVYL